MGSDKPRPLTHGLTGQGGARGVGMSQGLPPRAGCLFWEAPETSCPLGLQKEVSAQPCRQRKRLRQVTGNMGPPRAVLLV